MTTLVLLPGMDGTGELFAPLVAALDPAITTIVVEYPGHTPATYAQLLDQVRACLPAGRPFFLLGESFSGPLALLAAAERPPGLRGVILSTSFARNPRPRLAWLARCTRLLASPALPVYLLALPLYGAASTRERREQLGRVLARVAPSTLALRLREVMAVDVTAAARQIAVPIIYLQGATDTLVGAAAAQAVCAAADDVHVVRFDAPHMLLQVVPDEAARTVSAFVARCLRRCQCCGGEGPA